MIRIKKINLKEKKNNENNYTVINVLILGL